VVNCDALLFSQVLADIMNHQDLMLEIIRQQHQNKHSRQRPRQPQSQQLQEQQRCWQQLPNQTYEGHDSIELQLQELVAFELPSLQQVYTTDTTLPLYELTLPDVESLLEEPPHQQSLLELLLEPNSPVAPPQHDALIRDQQQQQQQLLFKQHKQQQQNEVLLQQELLLLQQQQQQQQKEVLQQQLLLQQQQQQAEIMACVLLQQQQQQQPLPMGVPFTSLSSTMADAACACLSISSCSSSSSSYVASLLRSAPQSTIRKVQRRTERDWQEWHVQQYTAVLVALKQAQQAQAMAPGLFFGSVTAAAAAAAGAAGAQFEQQLQQLVDSTVQELLLALLLKPLPLLTAAVAAGASILTEASAAGYWQGVMQHMDGHLSPQQLLQLAILHEQALRFGKLTAEDGTNVLKELEVPSLLQTMEASIPAAAAAKARPATSGTPVPQPEPSAAVGGCCTSLGTEGAPEVTTQLQQHLTRRLRDIMLIDMVVINSLSKKQVGCLCSTLSELGVKDSPGLH